METAFKTYSILATIFTCFFWSMALFFSGYKRRSPQIYVFLLLLIATFVYTMVYAKFHGHYHYYTLFYPLQGLFVLSFFPFFYLYVHTLTKPEMIFQKKYLLHFIFPTVIFITVFIINKIWMTREEDYLFISEHIFTQAHAGNKFKIGYFVYRGGKLSYIITSLIYLGFSYKDYLNHKKHTRDIFSSESKDLKWFNSLSLLFVLVVIFNFIIHYLKNDVVNSTDLLVAISYLIFTTFFWILGFYTYNQKDLFSEKDTCHELGHYKSRKEEITKKDIALFIENERPFLNPEVNIYDFCKNFATNRTYISYVINKSFNMNFRTLINSYRINEAKNLLKNNDKNHNFSLDYIAGRAGFKSYSTFLRVFKEHENITPAEFRELNILQSPKKRTG